MPEDYLSPEYIIDELKVTKSTVYGWIKKGILPAIKVGNLYRIRREDYEKFKRPATEPKKK